LIVLLTAVATLVLAKPARKDKVHSARWLIASADWVGFYVTLYRLRRKN
jgi:hypothetical protein